MSDESNALTHLQSIGADYRAALAKIESLTREKEKYRDAVIVACQQRDKAFNERDANAKDAERWRYLRNRFDNIAATLEFCPSDDNPDCWVLVKQDLDAGKDLDHAIDAASSVERGKGNAND